jgi:1,2-diacylglycerol 3-alpha-glucosyltransferase
MKIGIFTNAYKPIISGVVNSIELIKKGMKARGHKVYIFAPKFQEYRDQEAGVFRFLSVNLSTDVQFPLAIPFSPRIFAILERLDLDVIHTHHPFLLGKLGVQFGRRKNIPIVFTFHTQYEQYSHYIPLPGEVVRKVTRFSVQNYTSKCDQIICPSSTILSLLDEYGVTTPVRMIHNAIDLSQFRNAAPERIREKYGIGKEEKLLIYVGRMAKEKNIEFMLDSFKTVQKDIPEAKLMIVGEGPELESLEDYGRSLGIADRVIFTGRVEYREIPDYYNAAYAFVMTSTTEVKPLALLEAMASGLPIVAISAPGSSDTVNHDFDGYLTDNNMESFTGGLVRVLSNMQVRDRLSQGAYKTSEQYSMENTARILEDLYMELIKRKVKEQVL